MEDSGKKLRKADKEKTAESFHRLRIEAKKIRYGLDLVPSLFDQQTTREFTKSIRMIQEELGLANDCVVQLRILGRISGELKGTRDRIVPLALSIGALTQRLHQEEADHRKRSLRELRRLVKIAGKKRFASLFSGAS